MYIARMPLVAAAGLVGFAMAAAIAVAQDNSSSTTPSSQSASKDGTTQTSGQSSSSVQSEGVQAGTQTQTGQSSSATNPSNLPNTTSGTTPEQSKAPVVDPNANTQTPSTGPGASGQAGGTPNANQQNGNTQQWPSPQRYEAGRGAGSSAESSQGGATLGVNIVSSEDGRGVIVARIRPGTPADQMGLRPRDRIISVNGQPLASIDEFISTIRSMKPGTEVQLSIEREGATRDIRGKLGALREAIAAGEGPVGNIIGRAREFVGGERSSRIRDSYRSGDNMQTSYEDGNVSGRQPSSDLEARLSRVEQEISQLTRDVSEIRTSLRSNPTTSPALPNVGAPAPPSTRGASPFRPTPGQPPSGLQPQSR
jgi:hypothetical protein